MTIGDCCLSNFSGGHYEWYIPVSRDNNNNKVKVWQRGDGRAARTAAEEKRTKRLKGRSSRGGDQAGSAVRCVRTIAARDTEDSDTSPQY